MRYHCATPALDKYSEDEIRSQQRSGSGGTDRRESRLRKRGDLYRLLHRLSLVKVALNDVKYKEQGQARSGATLFHQGEMHDLDDALSLFDVHFLITS